MGRSDNSMFVPRCRVRVMGGTAQLPDLSRAAGTPDKAFAQVWRAVSPIA
jgi:hypothetical protein